MKKLLLAAACAINLVSATTAAQANESGVFDVLKATHYSGLPVVPGLQIVSPQFLRNAVINADKYSPALVQVDITAVENADCKEQNTNDSRFAKMLADVTNGDKLKAVAFITTNVGCLPEFAAAKKALNLGYKNILFTNYSYPENAGGINALAKPTLVYNW